jgi:hypothetical protein
MRNRMGRRIYMCKGFLLFEYLLHHTLDLHTKLRMHRIVGKGNHSVSHIQKIKPRVEQICQELGLQYSTEQNEGRMYINLQGGPAIMPPYPQPSGHQHREEYQGGQQQQQQQQGYQGDQPQYGPQRYQGGQQQYGGQQQQQGNNDEVEKVVVKILPRILNKLGCCVVM